MSNGLYVSVETQDEPRFLARQAEGLRGCVFASATFQPETASSAREVRFQYGPPGILRHVQEVGAVELDLSMTDGVPQQNYALDRVMNSVCAPLRPRVQKPVLQATKSLLTECEPFVGEVPRPWIVCFTGRVVSCSAF